MAITSSAKLAGVIGWPVSHSLSPRLHSYWLNKYKVDGFYIPLAVRPKDLKYSLRALPKMGFSGVNITAPHKERAFQAMDSVSAVASRLGAVNTVVIDENGKLRGENTDGFGFVENLRNNWPELNFNTLKPLVLGAGGAARAIIAALQDAGVCEIQVANRTFERAQSLAKDLSGKINILPWADMLGAMPYVNILINTTTLGMQGMGALNIDFSKVPKSILVTDVVYNPLRTPILIEASVNGNPVLDGLDMLLYQAQPGFSAWFGEEPDVTPDLRSFVLKGY
ncbi:MAG: shikimate dehydrogenase [Magnetovibrio sp.]|nr:shikimate dehydrogenase [Magnetovibrio sp.]